VAQAECADVFGVGEVRLTWAKCGGECPPRRPTDERYQTQWGERWGEVLEKRGSAQISAAT